MTKVRRKASVTLRREFRDGPTLTAAMAALEARRHGTQAPLVRAVRPCFSSGRAHRAWKTGIEPNEQAPTPVHASSLYRATRKGWGPSGQPPSWLLPAHSPGRSWPLSRPERHGCHSTSQSTPTTEVTARAQIARARLGLVTKRCLEVPPERMQGGSLWPGRALERQRSAAHDPRAAHHGQLLSLAVQWGVAIEIERAVKTSARFC